MPHATSHAEPRNVIVTKEAGVTLGVELAEDESGCLRPTRVLFAHVRPTSQVYGMVEAGDVLVAVNGVPCDSGAAAAFALRDAGGSVTLRVFRPLPEPPWYSGAASWAQRAVMAVRASTAEAQRVHVRYKESWHPALLLVALLAAFVVGMALTRGGSHAAPQQHDIERERTQTRLDFERERTRLRIALVNKQHEVREVSNRGEMRQERLRAESRRERERLATTLKLANASAQNESAALRAQAAILTQHAEQLQSELRRARAAVRKAAREEERRKALSATMVRQHEEAMQGHVQRAERARMRHRQTLRDIRLRLHAFVAGIHALEEATGAASTGDDKLALAPPPEAEPELFSVHLRVCVPASAHSFESRVCDPWGASPWMQTGGGMNVSLRATSFWDPPWRFKVRGGGGTSARERLANGLLTNATHACVEVNVSQLALWWHQHRSRPPFLTPTSSSLSSHLLTKNNVSQREPNATELALLMQLLKGADATRGVPQQQSLRRCAFVGSGHDLRCNDRHGRRKGREIDTGFDAVFRSNAAQQLDHPHKHYINASYAGRRTDFRTNCLFRSQMLPSAKDESLCMLPKGWWHWPWGREETKNTRHACCEKPRSSLYSLETLARLANESEAQRAVGGRRARLVFIDALDGASSAVAGPAVANAMHSTGGNTLLAATALCDRIDVFGMGLFSLPARLGADKVYLHYYDDYVAACERSYDAGSFTAGSWALKWLKQRLADELTLHLLHALGVVHWRTD